MEEKELIKKSISGDELAFGELVKNYHPKILQLCRSIVKDEEIAQDLTQEAFVHSYQHLNDFRMESSFYTWLYRIAKNLSIDWLRKRHKGEEELHEEFLHAASAANNLAPQHELEQAIQEGLKFLPEKQKVVFEMADLQKLSTKEIAFRLNIPDGTVRSRLYYARRKLRVFLQKYRKG